MKVTKDYENADSYRGRINCVLVFLALKNSLFTTIFGLFLMSIGLWSYGNIRQNNIYISAPFVCLIGLFLIHTQYSLNMTDKLLSAAFLIGLIVASFHEYYKKKK